MKIEIAGKTLKFSHKNDFDNGEIHYLFALGSFLYWVEVVDGIVKGISPTLRDEGESWEWWDKPFPEEEFLEHEEFNKILDTPENIKKFQDLLG